ncbi:dihydroneopterin aldolase [Basilea psittacipulmonis]|uniref:7,8-dihydroneopterin aldolase n=1 Tax=Basilea psittacipulmonis DSM 24701 TaxID=1072685 RepID=A0A077DGD5_9BURK|nr:dihydroneopterin aldolase [Basilea psittacipulmonis]AIL32198.1 dihydroneopterin aldolase [Basilea psittacipulmonis DSM 24701]
MTIRRIFFSRLSINARIGVLEHELRATQPIVIDAELDVNLSQEINDKNIDTVLDYRYIRQAIIDECTREHIHLIEVMADRVNQRILNEFPQVSRVHLRISKPLAFSDCAAVGIEQTNTRES